MKKNKANVCLTILSGLLAIGILSGCGEKKANEIRIGYFPNVTHSQALVMRDQGELEKQLDGQYEVKWKSFQAGPAEVEALFAGELDMGLIGPGPAISANVKSMGDFVVLSGAANGGATLVAGSDSGIESIADLDGKKVAIPQLGNTQHLMLLNLLAKNELKVTTSGGTVELVAAANADLANLFEQGQIDAALVPEPWGSILMSDGSVKKVTNGNGIEDLQTEATTVVIVNKEYMETNPEAVQTFLEQFESVTDFVAGGSDEVRQCVQNGLYEETGKEFDAQIIDNALKSINFTTEAPKDSLKGYGEIMCREQMISKEPDEKLYYEKK